MNREKPLLIGGSTGPVLVICLTVLLVGAQSSTREKLTYPETPKENVVDDYFGTSVPDPYRWLEDLESARTQAWVEAEGALTVGEMSRLHDRDAMRQRLSALMNYSRTGLPWREPGGVFYEENGGLEPQSSFYVLDTPEGTPRRVLDAQAISPDGSTFVGNYVASPDGRRVAYTVSPGGADLAEMHVRDIVTGHDLPDVAQGTLSAACWTNDSQGFFYFTRAHGRAIGATDTAARIGKQAYYHVLGDPQEKDRLIHEWPDAGWVYAMMSDDGRRTILVEERGQAAWMSIIDVGDAMHPDPSAPLVPLLADLKGHHTPMGTVGNTLYVFTNHDAPRGRVVALDLDLGAAAAPREIIAQDADVLQRATVAGDRLVVHYLHDVTSRLELFTLDGKHAGKVPLPGIGALGWALNGRNSSPEVWYSFTSFLVPETVYRYDLNTGKNTPFHAPKLPFDPSGYETRQIFYSSKDGTRVPMFITARKSLKLDGDNPAYLTAYGGYGTVNAPAYMSDAPMWLESGGVLVLADIRGGGEYGEQWHLDGARDKKQNSFDDFIAAAEYLVREKYTAPEKLAIYGHSNGGLLMGVMITQRPDLFAAVIANAGHHDMLRYHLFTVGAGWIPEYLSPESEDGFRVLYAYSPLQRVREGTCYPAVMLLTGDHDDRVVPGHSYKFAAALQAAQACGSPILLRVASDASHSYASGAGFVSERADVWAFIADRLGVSMMTTP